jgi:hypothetical protein
MPGEERKFRRRRMVALFPTCKREREVAALHTVTGISASGVAVASTVGVAVGEEMRVGLGSAMSVAVGEGLGDAVGGGGVEEAGSTVG